MKVRTDFVTNSSSSSFIIARKDKLTKEQTDIISDYVESNMLGKKTASTKEELMQYFKDEIGWDDEDFNNLDNYYSKEYVRALQEIENGLSIYTGTINFETCYDSASELEELWSKLDEGSSKDFVGIDISLDY